VVVELELEESSKRVNNRQQTSSHLTSPYHHLDPLNKACYSFPLHRPDSVKTYIFSNELICESERDQTRLRPHGRIISTRQFCSSWRLRWEEGQIGLSSCGCEYELPLHTISWTLTRSFSGSQVDSANRRATVEASDRGRVQVQFPGVSEFAVLYQ